MQKSLLLSLLVAAAPAWAVSVPVENNPKGLVKHLEVTGCGNNVTARLEIGAEHPVLINRNLVLDFGDLFLGAEDKQGRLACLVDVDIQIAPGLQFRINEGAVQGYAEGDGLKGSVGFDYDFPETGDSASVDKDLFVSSHVDDFSLVAKVNNPQYTRCSSQPQVFRLSGSVFIDLNESKDPTSVIRITGSQQNSADKHYGVGWKWNCLKCNP